MSTRCAAIATLSPIYSEGAWPTRASGIGERSQHAVAGDEIAIRVDGLQTDTRGDGREMRPPRLIVSLSPHNTIASMNRSLPPRPQPQPHLSNSSRVSGETVRTCPPIPPSSRQRPKRHRPCCFFH
jgi:hypothetical protein